MNDTKYANEEALADPQRLQETLANWLPLSSSLDLTFAARAHA